MHIIKKLFMGLSAILLLGIIYLGVQLVDTGKKARVYKSDYTQLHSVQYGMFNSDVWTAKITQIIDDKIENFNLNSDNKNEVKKYIETIIDTLVIEAERVVRERNHKQRGFFESIVGSTKQMITDSIIDFKDLRKRVPEFTNTVMHEMEKEHNQARAKKVIRDKIKAFMKSKFKQTTDMATFNAVIVKYKAKDLAQCNKILDTKLQQTAQSMQKSMLMILSITGIIILLILLQGTLDSIGLFILSATTVTLLLLGIQLPMLDIEAKISKLIFTILDKPIVFDNQILFFQSKSISDLVRLLLESSETKMIFVGMLLVMFSIIFPTIKLFATYLYYYSASIIGNNPLTRFFALRSTKWSMADVMVVSIFMAYLGLDGVVSSELKHLESQSDPINIITTNGSHLEVGFFLFLGFVLTSFVLSLLVEKYKQK
jgi:hypothetical protein